MLDVRPNGIISTAMLLHDWQRAVIEQVFGCKVTNRYGCEEVSLIACECEEHDGLHVNADSVYTEVSANPDRQGGGGRPPRRSTLRVRPAKLLVTDLIEPRDAAHPLPDRRRGGGVGAGVCRAVAGCR